MYYIVMNSWNVVIARLDDADEAARCARANNGYVVPCQARMGGAQ